ncbi:unnamed protein product [Symbiodinium sp. CCMP2592]|nr:unnamed protein product [Symbiodinium sp. CCMP2592]
MMLVGLRAVFVLQLLVAGQAGRVTVAEHNTGWTCCIVPGTSWTAEQMLEIYKFVLYHPAAGSDEEREANAKELWDAVDLGSKVAPLEMSVPAQEQWLANSKQVQAAAKLADTFAHQSRGFYKNGYWFRHHECLAGVLIERVEDAWLQRWRCDEGNMDFAWLAVLRAEGAYSSQKIWADVGKVRSIQSDVLARNKKAQAELAKLGDTYKAEAQKVQAKIDATAERVHDVQDKLTHMEMQSS